MTDTIVTFRRPPVVETVLSVGFDPIDSFSAAAFGLFWSRVKDRFPTAEERPRYDMPVESQQTGRSLSIQLGNPVTRSRVLLIGNDPAQVCQIQRDWFAVNWRQSVDQPAHHPYQRYGRSRQAFMDLFAEFEAFANEELKAAVRPTQCEVSYVNRLTPTGGWSGLRDLHHAFTFLCPFDGAGVGGLEQFSLQFARRLERGDEEFGRLHVTVSPIGPGDDNGVTLSLTARGAPATPDIDGVLNFLDLGRRAIVLNFKMLTTDLLHREWEIEQ